MKLFARIRSWLTWMVKRSQQENTMEVEVRFHIESYAAGDRSRSGPAQGLRSRGSQSRVMPCK